MPQVPPVPCQGGLTGLLLKDKQGITVVVRVQIPMERDQMLVHKGSQAAASLNRSRFEVGLEPGLVKHKELTQIWVSNASRKAVKGWRSPEKLEGSTGAQGEDKPLPAKQRVANSGVQVAR